MADAPSPHGLNSTHHSGTLADAQAPQFLKTDGTRSLTGNLAVSSGVTIDGVDLSALLADFNAHAGDPLAHGVRHILDDAGNAVDYGVSNHDVKIYGAGGITVTKTVDGLQIDGSGVSGGGGGGSDFSGLKSDNGTGVSPDGLGWITLDSIDPAIAIAAGTNKLTFDIVPGQISHNALGSIGANDHHTAFIGMTVGANSVNPDANDRVTLAAGSSKLTVTSVGSTITLDVDTSSLQSTIDHGSLSGLGDDDHGQYMHISNARTVTARHTFNPNPVSSSPFIVGANATGVLVSGLNADQVDGYDFDQYVLTTSFPTFAGATLSNLTASRLMATNASKQTSSVADLTAYVAGTANRITVTDDGDGTITLNTPQDLHTAASVQFGSILLNNTGLRVYDNNPSPTYHLSIVPGDGFTANRTLAFATGDASRTITLSGNPTLADWFNQSVKSTATPTFARVTLSQTTGTAPLTVSSTTLVSNLTSHYLGAVNQDASFFRNASNINAGTLADARLSSNVPLKDAANTFSDTQKFDKNDQMVLTTRADWFNLSRISGYVNLSWWAQHDGTNWIGNHASLHPVRFGANSSGLGVFFAANNGDGGIVNFSEKIRFTAQAGHLLVGTTDDIATLGVKGTSGADIAKFQTSAGAAAFTLDSAGDATFANDVDITGGLTVDSNVGIGTASPGAKLDVNGNLRTTPGSGGTLTLYETDATRQNRLILGADASGSHITSTYSTGGTSDLRFVIGGSESMRIKGGNVGIGTAGPGAKLHVSGGTVRIESTAVPFILRETDQTLPVGLWRVVTDGGTLRIDRNTDAAGGFATYKSFLNVGSDGLLRLGETATLYIPSTGSVGIATDSPNSSYKLHVAGDVLFDMHLDADSAEFSGTVEVIEDFQVFNPADLTTPVLYVDQSLRSIGINQDPDSQFDLDVAGNIRGKYIVGEHAIQLSDAELIAHFDGPGPFETDFTGDAVGHKGQVSIISGGVIWRPGKFDKAIQIAEATTNLCPNPSFETGLNNWIVSSNNGGGSATQSSDRAKYGAYSAKLIADTGGGTSWLAEDDWMLTLADGESCTAQVWAWAESGGLARLSLLPNGQASVHIDGSLTEEWEHLVGSYTNNTGSSLTVRVVLYNRTGDGTTAVYWDAVQLEQKAYVTPYCDGSLGLSRHEIESGDSSRSANGTAINGHSWSGTAHASTSSRDAAYITFDGSDYLPGMTNQGTVFFWWIPDKAPVSGAHDGLIWIGHENALGQSIKMGVWNDLAWTVYFRDSQDTNFTDRTSATDDVFAGEPLFVAMTWASDGTVRWYAYSSQNKYENTLTTTAVYGDWYTDTIRIGQGLASNPGNGLIDEFTIVSRAMDADEIRTIYESNAPVFAERASHYYKSYGPTPVEINEEGLFVRNVIAGETLAVYGGGETKSWGGRTLYPADSMFGQAGQGYIHWHSGALRESTGLNWQGNSSQGDEQLEIGNARIVVSLGGTDRIVLDPDTPSLAIGSTAPSSYSTGTGIWMGDSSGYKFRVGDPNGVRFDWTGSSVIVGHSGAEHILMDGANLDIKNSSTVLARLAGSTLTLGDTSTEHVQITSTAVNIKDGSTTYTTLIGGALTLGRIANSQSRAEISSGSFKIINRSSGGADSTVIQLDASGNAFFGDIANANLYWNQSAGQLQFRDATTVQAYVDTDGKVKAGAGNVILDAIGLWSADDTSIEMGGTRSTPFGKIRAASTDPTPTLWVSADGGTNTKLRLDADNPSGQMSYIDIKSGSDIVLDPHGVVDVIGTLTVNTIDDSGSGVVTVNSKLTVTGATEVGAIQIDGIITTSLPTYVQSNAKMYLNNYVGIGVEPDGTNHLKVSGDVLFTNDLDVDGLVTIGASTQSGQLTVKATSASTVSLVVDTTGSPSVPIMQWKIDGVERNYMTSDGNLVLNAFDNGSNIGRYIQARRNTDASGGGTNSAAAFIILDDKGGTPYRIWPDDSGILRIWAGGNPVGSSDTSGIVVGSQSSLLETKDILGPGVSPDVALQTILDAPVVHFTYKSGAYNDSEFHGIVADWSPEFAMDDGRSFNPVSAFGFTVQSVKALYAEIESLKARIKELEN